MARSSRFTRPRGTSKRLTEWSGLADQTGVNVASAGATLISSVSFEDPGTIVRARGSFMWRPQVYNADLSMAGAFGIGLVSSEALAVGITAIPTPFSDSDWGGWMVWQSFSGRMEFRSDAGTRFADSFVEIQIDSKAMRKVEPSTAMVFVAESQSGAMFVAEQVRLLQLLH